MKRHPSQIAISDYQYNLPDAQIPRYPLEERDQSRLLVYKNDAIGEDQFVHIAEHLPKNALLVFNETKVIQARLFFENRNSKKIEVFCLEPDARYAGLSQALESESPVVWNSLVGGLRSWKEDILAQERHGIQLSARILERLEGFVSIEFSWSEKKSFSEILEHFGNLPIPPYLNRATEASDLKQYQTVYSKQEGSVAAPTAGLHFTEKVFQKLEAANVQRAQLVLHVGAGTFQPVKAEKLEGHNMHAEYLEVERSFIEQLIQKREDPIIAVGTTSLRTLESLYWMGVKAAVNPNISLEELEVQQWDPYNESSRLISKTEALIALLNWMLNNKSQRLVCRTRILIAPPYDLKVATGIVTNFHQPQSTLLLLIAAIVGEAWRDIYNYALDHNFRFLSYGDSSLLLK